MSGRGGKGGREGGKRDVKRSSEKVRMICQEEERLIKKGLIYYRGNIRTIRRTEDRNKKKAREEEIRIKKEY